MIKQYVPGADPGFFLGGGALVSFSTSTPINHIVFVCRVPVVLENRRSSQWGGGRVRTPCTLDPPLCTSKHCNYFACFYRKNQGYLLKSLSRLAVQVIKVAKNPYHFFYISPSCHNIYLLITYVDVYRIHWYLFFFSLKRVIILQGCIHVIWYV